MKYRKKHIYIDAFKYDGEIKKENGKYCLPEWAIEAFETGIFDWHNGKLIIVDENGNWKYILPHCYILKTDDEKVKYDNIECWAPELFETLYEEVE